MLTLSDSQLAPLLKEAQAELVQRLLSNHRDDLELLTPAQVCGLLNVNQKTLDGVKIPRVTLVPGKVIRYRACDVAAFLNDRRDNP